jgi:hypothetical protein
VQAVIDRIKEIGARSVRVLDGIEENVTFPCPRAWVRAPSAESAECIDPVTKGEFSDEILVRRCCAKPCRPSSCRDCCEVTDDSLVLPHFFCNRRLFVLDCWNLLRIIPHHYRRPPKRRPQPSPKRAGRRQRGVNQRRETFICKSICPPAPSGASGDLPGERPRVPAHGPSRLAATAADFPFISPQRRCSRGTPAPFYEE